MSGSMHHQLAQICFQLAKRKSLNQTWLTYEPSEDWLEKFAHLIFNTVSIETQATTYLKAISSKLDIHIRNPELKIILQRLYGLMSGSIEDPSICFKINTDIPAISEKLFEGLINCTEGFQDRANLVWMSLFFSLETPDLLQKIRDEIVQSVARNLYDEVHAQNSVYTIAARELPFGTNAIHASDHYLGTINPKTIKEMVTQAFQYHYTPLLIIKGIEEAFRSQMAVIGGYTGCKESGYLASQYDSFIEELLIPFCPQKKEGAFSYFLSIQENTDGRFNVVDVQWGAVRQVILDKLIAEGFFDPSTPGLCNDLMPSDDNQEEFIYWARYLATEAQLMPFLEKSFDELNNLCGVLLKEHPFMHHIHTSILDRPVKDRKAFFDWLLKTFHNQSFDSRHFSLHALIIPMLEPIHLSQLLHSKNEATKKYIYMLIVERSDPKHFEQFLKQFQQAGIAEDLFNEFFSIALLRTLSLEKILILIQQASASAWSVNIPFASIERILSIHTTRAFEKKLKLTSTYELQFLIQLTLMIKIKLKHPILYQDLLLMAIKQAPTAILEIFKSSGQEQINPKILLLSQSPEGLTPLMLAAKNQEAQAIDILLKIIKDCSLQDQSEILTAIGHNGYNALMLAAQHQPHSVLALLNMIQQLDPEIQAIILFGKTMLNETMLKKFRDTMRNLLPRRVVAPEKKSAAIVMLEESDCQHLPMWLDKLKEMGLFISVMRDFFTDPIAFKRISFEKLLILIQYSVVPSIQEMIPIDRMEQHLGLDARHLHNTLRFSPENRLKTLLSLLLIFNTINPSPPHLPYDFLLFVASERLPDMMLAILQHPQLLKDPQQLQTLLKKAARILIAETLLYRAFEAQDQTRVIGYLNVVKLFDPQTQILAFKNYQSECNILILSIQRELHTATQILLTMLDQFDPKKRADILKQTNSFNRSALYGAIEYQSNSVFPLLRSIQGLEKRDQIELLEFSLIFVANSCQSIEIAQAVIQAIQTLDKTAQAMIACNISSSCNSYNCIQIAILKYSHEQTNSLPVLLKFIASLDLLAQRAVLLQGNISALSMAARHTQKTLMVFLDFIESLDPLLQMDILKHRNKFQESVLDYLEYNLGTSLRQNLKPLMRILKMIESFKDLNQEDLRSILGRFELDHRKAFNLISRAEIKTYIRLKSAIDPYFHKKVTSHLLPAEWLEVFLASEYPTHFSSLILMLCQHVESISNINLEEKKAFYIKLAGLENVERPISSSYSTALILCQTRTGTEEHTEHTEHSLL